LLCNLSFFHSLLALLALPFQCTTTVIMQWLFHVISSSVWFSLAISLNDIKYSNQWSVQIDGGKEEADRLARKHGFVNEGKVSLMHARTCTNALF